MLTRILTTWAAAAFFLLPALAQDQAAQPNKYVGSKVCRGCHPAVWLNFNRNPHFKSIASGDEAPENTGCESCHGPGSDHVKAGGGAATIQAFSHLKPDQALDVCLRCHTKDLSKANIRRSSHTEADVVCNNCHSIHKSPETKFLLAKRQQDLCYSCHANVRQQFSMPFKHRVNEGFMQCSDCHNPHGSPAPTWRMGMRPRHVSTVLGGEEPCLRCHSDKRGPFVYEHPAVRVDGCEVCHQPHGSPNPRLLRRPVVFTICLECHNGADSFGRQANGIFQTPRDHNMSSPRFQNCTTCHVRIHGSNSDALFLR